MWWDADDSRQTIETASPVPQLRRYVLGNFELTPAPVRDIEILLRKRMPRDTAVESGETTRRREDALAEFE